MESKHTEAILLSIHNWQKPLCFFFLCSIKTFWVSPNEYFISSAGTYCSLVFSFLSVQIGQLWPLALDYRFSP